MHLSLTSLVRCPRARSSDVEEALALDLTQQWNSASFVSALDAIEPQTAEVTAAKIAAEDVDAKVLTVGNSQAQLRTDVQSVKTAMNELDATLVETIQNLRQVVQDFNTLVRGGRHRSILPQ